MHGRRWDIGRHWRPLLETSKAFCIAIGLACLFALGRTRDNTFHPGVCNPERGVLLTIRAIYTLVVEVACRGFLRGMYLIFRVYPVADSACGSVYRVILVIKQNKMGSLESLGVYSFFRSWSYYINFVIDPLSGNSSPLIPGPGNQIDPLVPGFFMK